MRTAPICRFRRLAGRDHGFERKRNQRRHWEQLRSGRVLGSADLGRPERDQLQLRRAAGPRLTRQQRSGGGHRLLAEQKWPGADPEIRVDWPLAGGHAPADVRQPRRCIRNGTSRPTRATRRCGSWHWIHSAGSTARVEFRRSRSSAAIEQLGNPPRRPATVYANQPRSNFAQMSSWVAL